MSLSSTDSDLESTYLERERIVLLNTIGLTIVKQENSDRYNVRGYFNNKIDLISVGKRLQEEAEAEKNFKKTTITINNGPDGNFLMHEYNDKETLYMEELSGYFVMWGFTELYKIIYYAQSLEHFVKMQYNVV
jgi:hypothetical protein